MSISYGVIGTRLKWLPVSFTLLILLSIFIGFEEINCDTNFSDVETFSFGRWLPYNLETGEVNHMGEFIYRRVD